MKACWTWATQATMVSLGTALMPLRSLQSASSRTWSTTSQSTRSKTKLTRALKMVASSKMRVALTWSLWVAKAMHITLSACLIVKSALVRSTSLHHCITSWARMQFWRHRLSLKIITQVRIASLRRVQSSCQARWNFQSAKARMHRISALSALASSWTGL